MQKIPFHFADFLFLSFLVLNYSGCFKQNHLDTSIAGQATADLPVQATIQDLKLVNAQEFIENNLKNWTFIGKHEEKTTCFLKINQSSMQITYTDESVTPSERMAWHDATMQHKNELKSKPGILKSWPEADFDHLMRIGANVNLLTKNHSIIGAEIIPKSATGARHLCKNLKRHKVVRNRTTHSYSSKQR